MKVEEPVSVHVRPHPQKARILQVLLPALVLLGSFLMFVLEPLTGKVVTPRFGGTAAVWSTCLTFFQLAVLCGYALTYFLSKLSFKRYLAIYAIVILLSALWMHLPSPDQWRPAATGDPVWQLLCVLISHVGIPSVLLCSISGTMQVWYRNMNLGNPYPLYSVSNIGSLAALLSYPLLMEPRFTVQGTMGLWGAGYCILVLGILGATWLSRRDASSAALSPNTVATNSPVAQGGDVAQDAISVTADLPSAGVPGADDAADANAGGAPAAVAAADANAGGASVAITGAERGASTIDDDSEVDEVEEGDLTAEQQNEVSHDLGNAAKSKSKPELHASPASAKASFAEVLKSGRKKGRRRRRQAQARADAQQERAPAASGKGTESDPPLLDMRPDAEVVKDDNCKQESLPSSADVELTRDRQRELPTEINAATTTDNTTRKEVLIWTALSMIGSLVLLTHTAYITSDIAPVPLLWIAPLALYLITFILVFASPVFYRPMLFIYSWPILTIVEMVIGTGDIVARLGINLANVFILCMICHGELAAAKPPASRLPTYWLCTSIGGVLGGLFVSIVAPLVFDFNLERVITYALMVGVSYAVMVHRRVFVFGYKPISYGWVGWSSTALMLLLVGDCLMTEEDVHRERNFYGCVQVHDHANKLRQLVNGQIMHGEQIRKPEQETTPLSYYQLCIAFIDTYLRWQSHGTPQHYGVIGLGVGTLAAYGHAGDTIDFFEIDPKIRKLANEYFTYLSKAKGTVNILMGDARATFQTLEPARQYDLILVDAFNGDAIPLHLVTIEAMKEYLAHLKPNGILLFHVSNRYIDLIPPVAATAAKLGMHAIHMDDHTSSYVILAHTPAQIDSLKKCREDNAKLLEGLTLKDVPKTNAKEWTDDFANLATFFRFK